MRLTSVRVKRPFSGCVIKPAKVHERARVKEDALRVVGALVEARLQLFNQLLKLGDVFTGWGREFPSRHHLFRFGLAWPFRIAAGGERRIFRARRSDVEVKDGCGRRRRHNQHRRERP